MKHKIGKALSMLLVLVLVISIANIVLAQEESFPPSEDEAQLTEPVDPDTVDPDVVSEPDSVFEPDGQQDKTDIDADDSVRNNSIGGTLWMDLNDDGVRDADEPAIANYPVYLYPLSNTSNAVKTVKTNANGRYSFANIDPGTYVLGVKPNELGEDQYLLPLVGIENNNKFKIDTNTWLIAITNPIEIGEDTVVEKIDAGMRNPMGIDPLSANDEASLRAAVENAESGDVITLLNDITLTGSPLVIPAGKSISFDGGKKLTGASGQAVISVQGKVTIIDITVAGQSGAGISASAGGAVNIEGGEVSSNADANYAVFVDNGSVTMSGGKVAVYGNTGMAIEVNTGNVTMSGGEVTVSGIHGYGISVNVSGTIKVTGGTLSGGGDFTAIYIGGGLAAYLAGTCDGNLLAFYDSIIVEVDSLSIPDQYNGTTNGLTQIAGNPISSVKWDTTEVIPAIHFNNGAYTIKWGSSATQPPATDTPVRIRETNELYETMAAAIDAAKSDGLNTFTLEVLGDVTETSDVIITAPLNVTIVGAEGKHTVTMSSNYKVLVQGGTLTLGEGISKDFLTMKSVTVTEGTINVKDGIILKSGGKALFLSGPNVTGTISGGIIEGYDSALNMEKGAQLIEISGGTFTGQIDAVHLSDAGTKIHKISGGEFYQINSTTDLHGHGIFVQNYAEIGEISGGYFDAIRHTAMTLIRGGQVGEIRGGEFVAHRYGTIANNDRNAAIRIDSGWQSEGFNIAGIGTISGGHFRGTNFGVLSISDNTYCYINNITGGTFEALIALQNDRGSVIGEISGGKFIGSQGIFNEGTIKKISGQADIQGTGSTNSYGIFNYSGGKIDEISGGMIVGDQQCIANQGTISLISGGTIISNNSAGISNSGTITRISGGTIIGQTYSIYCSSTNGKGILGTINGGVFWGKNNTAIVLVSPLILEPGLSADKGFGRYWGRDGVIFNNDNLVVFPVNAHYNEQYIMSPETEPVDGIQDTEFKYLRLLEDHEFLVTVIDSYADDTGAGIYHEGMTVTIYAGSRKGYTFAGWITDDGAVFADANSATTTFTMPDNNVTVTATWTLDEVEEPEEGGGSPKTGDTGLLPFLIVLFGVSFTGIMGGVVYKLRDKRREDSAQ